MAPLGTTVAAKCKVHLGRSARHTKLICAQYAAVKKPYQSGAYAEAIALFGAHRKTQHPPALAPYIHFYYALAAYHHGAEATARQTFLELQAQFPDWNKPNEVYYWCAQGRFEAGDVAKGFASLELFAFKHMAQSVLQMKKHFLKK